MRKLEIISFLILFVIILFSCKQKPEKEKIISEYLDSIEVVYENICKQAGMESWSFYSDTLQNEDNQYRKIFSSFLSNDTLHQNITSWSQEINMLKDEILKRRLILWNNILTWSKVDLSPEIIDLQNELEKKLANYPFKNNSKETIEQGIINLIHLRNNKAQLLGYSNYAFMMLQITEIDTVWFEDLIETIDLATKPKYELLITQIKHDNDIDIIKWSDIRPYVTKAYQLNNLPDISKNNKKELMGKTLKNIGLEIKNKPIQSMILDLPPGLGGLGIALDIPNDFRSIMGSDLEFRYMLHEIGHGLHWTHVAIKHPILKGYDYCANPTLLNGEAMAEIVGNFSRNSNWLLQNVYSESQIDSISELNQTIAPVWLRLNLINTLFEIELYRNSGTSAADIKTNLYKKYLNIDFDFNGRENLASLTYVSYPVYEQNYLIADIISWQIHDYLSQKFGVDYINNPEVGSFLINYLWKDGEFFSWRNKLINATGNDVDLVGYLETKGL